MAKILIVEDEAIIAEAVGAYLQSEGYETVVAADGISGWDKFSEEHPDVIILDLMLPGMSGEDLCRHIRGQSRVPILMLTAKSDESSLLYGFRIGADDYLTKPFSPRELLVRVSALLRRSGSGPAAQIIDFGEGIFRMDLEKRKLFRSFEEIHLTPIEYDILEKLISYPGRIFSREEIICSVMGCDFRGMDRTVDSHIRNLRSKIEKDSKDPRIIVTQRGRGFYFNG